MDYGTVLRALQKRADDMTHKTRQLMAKHPRKYADLKDKGDFWRSLAGQLEAWMTGHNGTMPFSPKQAFFVSKCIPDKLVFWAFWNAERRALGLWDNHDKGCKCESGLNIDDNNLVTCRDCGAQLGLFVPLSKIDPIYAATSMDLPDVVDLDLEGDINFFEGGLG